MRGLVEAPESENAMKATKLTSKVASRFAVVPKAFRSPSLSLRWQERNRLRRKREELINDLCTDARNMGKSSQSSDQRNIASAVSILGKTAGTIQQGDE